MAFTLFFFGSWLVLTLFTIIPKKLAFTENTFVFLILLVISINWTWIIYEEFKFIESTETPMDYAAFLMFRSIIIPIVIITQLNISALARSRTLSLWTIVLSTACLLLFTFFSLHFGMIKYVNWNIAYDALYYLALHGIAYVTLKIFQTIQMNEVNDL
ncbi:hypothetical protein SAMN04487936_107159 [Halobacillus dabanensis]|uniref:Uncharacterized protein n=1 Tax=Halobacillus dabanensis TaxID=240302 RepID=A0A1I3WUL3_HALDA|nr:hypothetical protein [Halobacillus dabanensis]SFK11334.1 hypothetical protein SAMN04487936_107159 [Halobacillus dabanensis]